MAAGLASSMAQVYSLNVVGYVNQTVQAGKWYMWGNPLSASTNTSAVVLAGLSGDPEGWSGAMVYGFTAAGGYTGGDSFIGSGFNAWFPGTTDLAPGNGFFFYAPTNGTVTFVGEVVTTNKFNLVGPNSWNMVSSAWPAANNLVAMGLIGASGDVVYRYDATAGYNAGTSYIPGYGWFDSLGSTTNGPVLNVGEGVFYKNANATVNWTQGFTIP